MSKETAIRYEEQKSIYRSEQLDVAAKHFPNYIRD
jgi:hypothetical protein